MNKIPKSMYWGVVICLILLAGIPTSWASGFAAVDLSGLNHDLDKAIEKDFTDRGKDFPYDPEIIRFDNLGIVDEVNQTSEYLMVIKTREGNERIKSEYYNLNIKFLIRDDLNQGNFQELFNIFPGQGLSNLGGYYRADYSDLAGAGLGFVVAEPERTEVNVPKDPQGVTPDEIMENSGLVMTAADDYVEIATAKLLTSEITGIPVEEIETTGMGHSLGAVQLLMDSWSDSQETTYGSLDKLVLVDTNVRYNNTSEYAELKAGQLENYHEIEEEINSGKHALDLTAPIFLAEQVQAGVPGAAGLFELAVSETHHSMSNPPTSDFSLWDEEADIDRIVEGMTRDGDRIAVSYSPLEWEWYIMGLRGGAIPAGELRNIDSALYLALNKGFGHSGTEYFLSQGMEIRDGGDGGHGFMFNPDSRGNWEYIWSWTMSN